MKKSAKFISLIFVVLLLSVMSVSLCACSFGFDGDDILSVRHRVDNLRDKMADDLGNAFIAHDVEAVKALFCTKSQALPDIVEQIENTFSFIDGNVKKYRKGERGYESHAANYGVVDEYEFDSKLFLTTDTDREYCLTFRVFYIVRDADIKGMTAYSIIELYNTSGDFCNAGYYWKIEI